MNLFHSYFCILNLQVQVLQSRGSVVVNSLMHYCYRAVINRTHLPTKWNVIAESFGYNSCWTTTTVTCEVIRQIVHEHAGLFARNWTEKDC